MCKHEQAHKQGDVGSLQSQQSFHVVSTHFVSSCMDHIVRLYHLVGLLFLKLVQSLQQLDSSGVCHVFGEHYSQRILGQIIL